VRSPAPKSVTPGWIWGVRWTTRPPHAWTGSSPVLRARAETSYASLV